MEYVDYGKHVIFLPKNLGLDEALVFIGQMWALPPYETITFDCSSLKHVEPFTMILVSQAIKNFRSSRPVTNFFVQGHYLGGYIGFMRFYENAGMVQGTTSYQPSSPQYTRITEVNCEELRQTAFQNGCHPCDLVEENSKELAETLARDRTSDMYFVFQYIIREMLRNVVEHSQAISFQYCAQYWPSKDWVEIAIVDSGIGLRASLSKNASLGAVNDQNALNLALTPGISSVVYGKGGPKSAWANSGFGLYMASRLCGEGGNFCLMSGTLGIVKNAVQSQLKQTYLNGTGVRINLRPSSLPQLRASLDRYAKDAEDIVGKLDWALMGMSPSTILKRN